MLSQVIDLAELPPPDRFPMWHDIVAGAAAPQAVETDHPHDFKARALICSLGSDVTLTSFKYPSLVTRRGDRQIRQGDPETWQLALPVNGYSVIQQGNDKSSTQNEIRPARDFTLIDSSRPHAVRHGPTDARRSVLSVTTVIPRCLIPLRRDRVERMAGERLDSTMGMGALLASQMMHIVQHANEFGDADADVLRGLIVDLAAATIGQALAEHLPDEFVHRTLRFKIDRFIDDQLSDPNLHVGTIAAAFNMSNRQVHRLFEGGRSISEEIRVRRFERYAHDLADPQWAHESVVTIGMRHGITQKRRRGFREHYGLTPAEYRRRHLGSPPPPDSRAQRG